MTEATTTLTRAAPGLDMYGFLTCVDTSIFN